MRDNWQLFSGEIAPHLCDSMIKEFLKRPEMEAETFNGSEKYRRSKVRWIHNENDLKMLFLRLINSANAVAFNVDIQQEMDEMQFTEYDETYRGKYDWHHDVDYLNPKHYDRKLSMVVQLSDSSDYEGGDFEFQEVESPPSDQVRKKGSVLIFPSYLQHRVTEVTKGKRYSLVSWVRGPRWK